MVGRTVVVNNFWHALKFRNYFKIHLFVVTYEIWILKLIYLLLLLKSNHFGYLALKSRQSVKVSSVALGSRQTSQ